MITRDQFEERYAALQEGLTSSEPTRVYFRFDIDETELTSSRRPIFITASLLTDEMLSFDREWLSALARQANEIPRAHIEELVGRPYCFEFQFVLGEDAVGEIVRSLVSGGVEWREGYLECSSESASSISKDDATISGFLAYGLHKVEMVAANLSLPRNGKGAVKRSKKVVEKVQEVYGAGSSFDIEECKHSARVAGAFASIKSSGLEIYSLGHGNCIRIGEQDSERPYCLYDVGFTYKMTDRLVRDKYPEYIPTLAQLTPEAVVLSHWDTDHFLGALYLPDKAFLSIWVVPPVHPDQGVNAERLYAVLCSLKSCFKYEPKYSGTELKQKQEFKERPLVFPMRDGSLMLWKGLKFASESNVKEQNQLGLALTVSAGNSYAMLYGDVPYASLSDYSTLFLRRSMVVVVPHHGSKMELNVLRDYGQASGADCPRAIVCAADDENAYPVNKSLDLPDDASWGFEIDREHLKALQECGFKVETTSGPKAIPFISLADDLAFHEPSDWVSLLGWDRLIEVLDETNEESGEKIEPFDSAVFDYLNGFDSWNTKVMRKSRNCLLGQDLDARCLLAARAQIAQDYGKIVDKLLDLKFKELNSRGRSPLLASYSRRAEYAATGEQAFEEMLLNECVRSYLGAYVSGVPIDDIVA